MQLPIPILFNIGAYSDPYCSIGATLLMVHDPTSLLQNKVRRTVEYDTKLQTSHISILSFFFTLWYCT